MQRGTLGRSEHPNIAKKIAIFFLLSTLLRIGDAIKATLVVNCSLLESKLIIECYRHELRQMLSKVDRTVSEGKYHRTVSRFQH